MYYFAYGSNMSQKRLCARVPSADFIVVALLVEHELRFHKIGKDGSAKCDAVHTGDTEHAIIGVLYKICETHKPILDQIEGLGKGYEEKIITVVTDDGEHLEATTYYATHIDPERQPFHWYKEHVLRGTSEYDFPSHYVQAITDVKSVDDPDFERHKVEMGIYL
ncbi:MAG: gamma-glutamylcyclotransferase family protein [Campylobacterota bacterium]|nr:gamma-glutamylcyclotransferase family protein [Campylobacterota bacterium]